MSNRYEIRIPPGLKQAALDKAAAEGVPLASVIRLFLVRWVKGGFNLNLTGEQHSDDQE